MQESLLNFLNNHQAKILNLESQFQQAINAYHGLQGMLQEAKETYSLIEKIYQESFKQNDNVIPLPRSNDEGTAQNEREEKEENAS